MPQYHRLAFFALLLYESHFLFLFVVERVTCAGVMRLVKDAPAEDAELDA